MHLDVRRACCLALVLSGGLGVAGRSVAETDGYGSYFPVVETSNSVPIAFQGVPFQYHGVDRWVTVEPKAPNPPPEIIDLSAFSSDVVIYRVHVITYASWALDLPNGSRVGTLTVHFGDGEQDAVFPLVVGENTAEWSYDRLEAQRCLAHSKLPGLEAFSWTTTQDSNDPYEAHNYYGTFESIGPYGARWSPRYAMLSVEPGLTEAAVAAPCATPGKYNVGITAITLEGYFVDAVAPATWGSVKTRFR
jgi:hypothetical protein